MARIWRTVRFDPKEGLEYSKTEGHDLQYKTRFGWSLVAIGNWDRHPCASKGRLLRNHYFKKGKCRRCGLAQADLKNMDILKKVEVK